MDGIRFSSLHIFQAAQKELSLHQTLFVYVFSVLRRSLHPFVSSLSGVQTVMHGCGFLYVEVYFPPRLLFLSLCSAVLRSLKCEGFDCNTLY